MLDSADKNNRVHRGRDLLVGVLLAALIGLAFAWLAITFALSNETPAVQTKLTEVFIRSALAGALVLWAASLLLHFRLTAVQVSVTALSACLISLFWVSDTFGLIPKSQHVITGQLLSYGNAESRPIPGAQIYFLPANYADNGDFLTKMYASEPGQILKAHPTSCTDVLLSLVRQQTGIAGPADANFYQVQQLWLKMKAHPEFAKLTPEQQQKIPEVFWKDYVLSDPEFAKLPANTLQQYHYRLLVGDDSDKKALLAIQKQPSVTTDSSGQFVANLTKGTYLLLADGHTDSEIYVWAVPFVVNGDIRLVSRDVVCRGPLF